MTLHMTCPALYNNLIELIGVRMLSLPGSAHGTDLPVHRPGGRLNLSA